jgi:hypothetical protein
MKKILSLVLIPVLALCSLPALAQTVPSEFVGDWTGRVDELDISLSFTICEDGSGTFIFNQNGYTDARDFTFLIDDGTFALSRGADGSTCSGSFVLEGGVLTLALETVYANGHTYGYVVKCERAATVQETEGLFGKESDFLSDDGAELRGFDTLEACAKAVAQALISGNTDAFLNCFAIAETASGFDISAYFDRLGSVTLSHMLLPPVSDFNIAYNEAQLTNTLLMKVAYGSLLLSNPNIAKVWETFALKKDYSAAQIMELATPGDELSRLIYQKIMKPSDLSDEYEKARERGYGWNYSAHGAREWDETVILFQLDGRTIYLPLGLVRYRGGWLASPLRPIIANYLEIPTNMLFQSE